MKFLTKLAAAFIYAPFIIVGSMAAYVRFGFTLGYNTTIAFILKVRK
jgi:hypothetical protein